MEHRERPKVSVSIKLEPAAHSFSSAQAPTLDLTLLLDHHSPITIYADDLSPSLMVKCGAFAIQHADSGAAVQQSVRTHCRIPPPTKVPVTLNRDLFHTLLPGVPLILSSPFTREPRDRRPRAADDPGSSTDAAATRGCCGVDGLQAGCEYVLTLAERPRVLWKRIRWWDHGAKDEVLRSHSDARKIRFRPGPHEPIDVDVSKFEPIVFRCLE